MTSPVRHINTLIKIVRECYQEGNPEEFNKYVDLIINSPQRMDGWMDGLVGGLLSYAKVEEQQPNFERINLNALIKDLVNEFPPEVSEYEVRIEVGKLLTIDCSPFHIHEAVYNIISNARKYRKKDTQPVIRISGYNNDTDKTASIIIEDNGIGFDSIHAEKIFKPFARAIGTGEVEGSGIGLATVRKILEMHDGTIKAEGTKGIGATFTLSIPITRAA